MAVSEIQISHVGGSRASESMHASLTLVLAIDTKLSFGNTAMTDMSSSVIGLSSSIRPARLVNFAICFSASRDLILCKCQRF